MGTTSYSITFLLFQLFLHLCLNEGRFQFGYVTGCKTVEREALLKFKHSLHDPSNRLSSWLGEDCCDWAGVGCDHITGHVRHLDLQNPGHCDLDDDDYSACHNNTSTELKGPNLDPSLVNLTNLRYLNLAGNDFHESTFPEFIGSMKHLEYLDFSYASFGGGLPSQLGNLTNSLSYIKLSHNSFNGPIPLWLRNMSALEHVYLDNNYFSHMEGGSIMGIVGNLCKLSSLDLSHNYIRGQIGEVYATCTGELRKLADLSLSDNRFHGKIPSSIGYLSLLELLSLSNNRFDGQIPSSIGDLSLLEYLALSYNRFDGRIPSSIRDLSSLKFLDLFYNRFDGQIPCSIGDLSLLEELDLSNNRFDGQIPSSIGDLSLLESLRLSNNRFDGQIPVSIGRLSSLLTLDVSSNFLKGTLSESHFATLSNLDFLILGLNSLNLNFTYAWIPPFQLSVFKMSHNKIQGPFPRWIQTQTYLILLDLSHNRIAGPITLLPSSVKLLQLSHNMLSQDNLFTNNNINGTVASSLCQLPVLDSIFLENNSLTGKIPNDCWENSTSLTYINLSNNSLEGQIPKTFFHRSRILKILDLGENQFTGQMPNVTGTQLSILRLRDNQLSGVIPFQVCSLHRLQILDLANNNLTGRIPNCLGKLYGMTLESKGMDLIQLGEDGINEVLKGELLTYINTMYLVNLDLSCNSLLGLIPEELSNLSALNGLNLSYNHLTGSIPQKIGQMRSLESLDLSNNNISGIIPASMSGLYSLSHLNLSHNKLHGEIPTGDQLQTLNDPSIYADNHGLCGDPLPDKCKRGDKNEQGKQGEPEQEDKDEDRYEKIEFYSVIILGFVTGFWGVIGTLLLKKQWRHALFQCAEDFMEYLYVQLVGKINRFKGYF